MTEMSVHEALKVDALPLDQASTAIETLCEHIVSRTQPESSLPKGGLTAIQRTLELLRDACYTVGVSGLDVPRGTPSRTP